MTNWVRLWSDMPTDPKWRSIRFKALQSVTDVSVSDVIGVFVHLLSKCDQNGDFRNWDSEDVAIALEIRTEQVEAIYGAMQGKVLDGNHLTGWNNRQPKREDVSTERVRAFRDRERTVTQCNAPEEKREESESNSLRSFSRVRAEHKQKIQIKEQAEITDSQIQAANERGLTETERIAEWTKFKTFNVAKGNAFEDWTAAWHLWLDNIPDKPLNGHAINGADMTSKKMTPAEMERHKVTHKIYVKQDTPAGEAWATWTRNNLGKSQVWDAKGGWSFPSEWPPHHSTSR